MCRHFAHPKCWGISTEVSKFIQVFILKCLLITCPNKTSKVLTLKLKSDLIQAYQRHWHYRKCLIVSLTQELLITPSHKWQSQTMSKIKTTSKVLLKPTSRINHGRRCARRPLYYGDSPQAPPPPPGLRPGNYPSNSIQKPFMRKTVPIAIVKSHLLYSRIQPPATIQKWAPCDSSRQKWAFCDSSWMPPAVNYCHKKLILHVGGDLDRPLVTIFGKVIIHSAQATAIQLNLIAIHEGSCLYGNCKVVHH